ncbi:MAG: hypothetical protein AUG44_27640 [Actinobacteria bacterium 13_1_20CM_3_71_11]|nr:MAG: hypothetical protein AUG44_27640 [Actinobacteria bacterium 13_1_20CM_3_71_11]
MAKKLETKLEIKSWDEKPYRELGDGRKFTRAEVVLAGTGDGLEGGTFEGLLYYRADGTSTYVTFMQITGSLDGHTGGIVLQGDGTFDGATAHSRYSIVDGTGELAGISGTAESVSTHADYPYMPLTLEYELG